MRVLPGIVLAGGLCLCLTAAGQTPKPPAKMAAARADYRKALDKAREASDEAGKRATEDYKRQLAAVVDEETKAGNVDGALLVREAIKKAEDGGVPDRGASTKEELKKALAGTNWNWGDAVFTFQADGLARHPVWEARRLVTRWQPVDRRTILLALEEGRDKDRLAVLQFSEPLDEFKGFDFEYRPLEPVKRMAPGPK